MKTSNKIFLAACTLYTLLAAASIAAFVRSHKASQGYAAALFGQLDQTRIRVLIADGEQQFPHTTTSSRQVLTFSEVPTPQTVRISGDTLYVHAMRIRDCSLPHLESYLLDGVPQPIDTATGTK